MVANSSARHFVLVHGVCHGAWCWYKLVQLLEDAGHKVTAIDLAASGRNQQPLEELQTFDDYHKPLYSFLECLPVEERVILVGHSMGGNAVSSAMERFPLKIALGVFAAAWMVGPNLTMDQILETDEPEADAYLDSEFTTDGKPDSPSITVLLGPKFLATKVFQNTPPEDVALAKLCVRASHFFNDEKSRKQLLVTKEKYGSVPRAYFIAGDDRILTTYLQRSMVEKNPPNDVREIVGADHALMASKPEELCSNLLEVAMKYY